MCVTVTTHTSHADFKISSDLQVQEGQWYWSEAPRNPERPPSARREMAQADFSPKFINEISDFLFKTHFPNTCDYQLVILIVLVEQKHLGICTKAYQNNKYLKSDSTAQYLIVCAPLCIQKCI